MKTIKIIALIIFTFLFFVKDGIGQGIQFTPFVGYQFGGKLYSSEGDIKLRGNLNYGAIVDIPLKQGTFFELSWSGTSTTAYLKKDDTELADIYIQYMMGGIHYERRNDKLAPSLGFGIGAAVFGPKNEPDLDAEWFFAGSIQGGIKYFLGERLGIRASVRLLLPFDFNGGSLWCGLGGCSIGVTSSTSIIQGDVSGGLILNIGK